MSATASPLYDPVSDEPVQSRDDDPAIERPLISRSGLELLYREHAARLTRALSRFIGRDEACEVVHDAFVRLATPQRAVDELECPQAYASTIATNLLRDRARAAARRALHLHQLATDSSYEPIDPHRTLEARESLCRVEQALARMYPRRRRIFMLHRFNEMTYAEIGIEVGMSEKGVKKQMAKALFELRDAVGPLA